MIIVIAIVAMLAPATAQAATMAVDMKNNMFTPQEITIQAGDTVTWTNQDQAKHDVNFGDFKSPLLSKGETYSHTFETAGTYDYVCDVHPFMKGRVIVQ
ncbi:cupredoxin domain-containing protein [Methanocella sp. MCL-LM]|uniref:cupredoxin domain-containing protein n=1 Tax=Methanocella sp. MCL-LM TaxID=3412035 RepID=UPI003C746B05